MLLILFHEEFFSISSSPLCFRSTWFDVVRFNFTALFSSFFFFFFSSMSFLFLSCLFQSSAIHMFVPLFNTSNSCLLKWEVKKKKLHVSQRLIWIVFSGVLYRFAHQTFSQCVGNNSILTFVHELNKRLFCYCCCCFLSFLSCWWMSTTFIWCPFNRWW